MGKKNDRNYIQIEDINSNTINAANSSKVLRITVNKEISLDAHISSPTTKIQLTYNKIRGAIRFMDTKTKEIIIESKIRGQINKCSPLILNQNQYVWKKACVLIMRINKWIYSGQTFKVVSQKICERIDNPLPEQKLINASAKFIHEIIYEIGIKTINCLISRQNIATACYYHTNTKKKLYRTSQEYHIHLSNQIPAELKFLRPATFCKFN